MAQCLWRGILVVVFAIWAGMASVVLRPVPLGSALRDRSHVTRVHPEPLEGPHPARRTPLAGVKAAAVAMLLTAAACSGEPGTSSRSPSLQQGSATPSPIVTSSGPSRSNAADYPNLSRFTDPFDRFAYKSAYSDCRFIGVDGIAEAFGGDPEEPRSVAQAYAVTAFPQSLEPREATFQGCLDAFETEAQ